jgi:nitroreductase
MKSENEVFKTIATRHCKRAFIKKEIDKNTILKILDISRNAASSKNTQPWQVYAVSGEKLSSLTNIMTEKFDNNIFDEPDYQYSPHPLSETHLERARNCGFSLFKLKNIERKDIEKRKAHDRENFECFGAPLLLLMILDNDSLNGTFLDIGLYLQNIMLASTSLGLGSCPQYSLTSYSKTIKKELSIPEDKILVCGLCLGYPDENAVVNSFIPDRIPVEKFTTWLD